jgi:hypothetical protein
MEPSLPAYLIPSLVVLALGAGLFGGWMGARAEHWDLHRRMVTIDGFFRANAARLGKVTAAAAAAPPPVRIEDMTEVEILREAQARGMLHTQMPRRSGE